MNDKSVKLTVGFVTHIAISNAVFVPFLEASPCDVSDLKEYFKNKKIIFITNTSSTMSSNEISLLSYPMHYYEINCKDSKHFQRLKTGSTSLGLPMTSVFKTSSRRVVFCIVCS